MAKKLRHFIIRYKAADGSQDTKYVSAETPQALKKKMWMLLEAYVIEVTPVTGWVWKDQSLRRDERLPRLPKADSPR